MSEKALEVLTKLGITADFTADDIDTDAVVTDFRTKQIELLKHDPDLLDPIKEEVKRETNIVATKKAKKALNEKWGLGLSNKELDETEYTSLLDLTYEKSKTAATAEVTTLQEQIIALTNKAKEIEESAETRVKDVERTWAEKYLSGRRNEITAKVIGEMDLIIGKDKAAKFLELEMKDKGYSIDFNEDGTAVVKKGEYEALKADKTGKLSIAELADEILVDFVKKSNGAPTNGAKTIQTIPENINPAMAQRLREMAEKFGA